MFLNRKKLLNLIGNELDRKMMLINSDPNTSEVTRAAENYARITTGTIRAKEIGITNAVMDFGQALEQIKFGNTVARKGWNGKGIYIGLIKPKDGDAMTHDFIYIDTTGLQTDNPDAPLDRVPWLASQTDMLAEDWQVVGD